MKSAIQHMDSLTYSPCRVPKNRNHNIDDIECSFRENYIYYQYNFMELIVGQLTDTSRIFKGDMQMAVLLAIIGQLALQATMGAAQEGTAGELPPERRGISTFRIADVTGIARETARRKLIQMEQMGWVVREGNFWCLAGSGSHSPAQRDLAEIDARAITRAARFHAAMAPLVENRDLLQPAPIPQ